MRFQRLFMIFALLLFSTSAQARTREAGQKSVSIDLGFNSAMSVDGANMMLGATGEYSFTPSFSGVGQVHWGLGPHWPLSIGSGVRYRFTGLRLPLSPYVETQITTGMLWNVNQRSAAWSLGVRPATGIDYFFSKTLSTGLQLAFNIGGTLGEGSHWYNAWELLVGGTYSF